MAVTIAQLNEKYKSEDSVWDFSLFNEWLLKKGVPQNVIDTTLKQTLMDFTTETLPKKHFVFDNVVLLRALVTKQKMSLDNDARLEKEAHESVSKAIREYDADWYRLSKWQKIKMVFLGRD